MREIRELATACKSFRRNRCEALVATTGRATIENQERKKKQKIQSRLRSRRGSISERLVHQNINALHTASTLRKWLGRFRP